MKLKLALPKGRLQGATAKLLAKAGLTLKEYHQASRSYRPRCLEYPELFVKVFQEKDIAVQVAAGNYDLGVCGLDWVKELLCKYPSDAVVEIRDLGYGRADLYVAASRQSSASSLEALKARDDTVTIVSEYPNLAESFALKQRLRRFRVFPVWGAAEVYPPEQANLALVADTSEEALGGKGLVSLARALESSAFLIANRNSLERKDASWLLELLSAVDVAAEEETPAAGKEEPRALRPAPEGAVFLALPDGHQQHYVMDLLKRAGLRIHGYHPSLPTRRPVMEAEDVVVKVVRPQDMPLQVANGNFDLAITGQDWLRDHLYRFPSSPVEEVLALGLGQVRIVAVVSAKLAAGGAYELRHLSGELPVLRLASEYVNIADKYARDNHLAPYKVIPTWGASEAFLPEDADVLIENAQTGRTLARHNLRIIETIFESEACVIANRYPTPVKESSMTFLVEMFRKARQASPVS